jgi:signal transduction histidine kinase
MLPLGSPGHVRGVLQVAHAEPRGGYPAAMVEMVRGFADQTALALELAERRRDNELLRICQERDRIARDLHDLAIQRLFATGMSLQGALRFADRPEAAERISRAVDDLDETIGVIRSTIFSLKTRGREGDDRPRARLLREVDRQADALGFAAALRVDGLVDTTVPGHVTDELVAVTREALSNVARHAGARHAEVRARIADGHVNLRITDDGCGPPVRPGRASGLANMTARARRLGGTCRLAPADGRGSVLEWDVPLPGRSAAGS